MPLKVEIVTPEGIVWSGEDIVSATLPTRSGEIQILSGHVPIVTMLNAGTVLIKKDGIEEDLAVDQGYARCMGDQISILTEAAIEVHDIDITSAEEAKEAALKAIEEAKEKKHLDEAELERLESVARFSIAQLLAKSRHK